MKNEKLVSWLRPKNDFIFKLIFGSDNENSKDLLLAFLNDVLNVPNGQSLVAVELLNAQLNKQNINDKAGILDVRARAVGYGHVNVEIQLTNQKNIHKRSLYYGAKVYEEQLGKGEEYHNLTRVVTINIIDFSFFTSESYRSCYRLMEEKTNEPYPDLMQLHFFEIPKFVKQEREETLAENDRMEKWMRFLSNQKDTRWDEMVKQDPMIEKAVDILRAASLDPETRMIYEAREKELKDMNSIRGDGLREGIERGIEKGELSKARAMARKMLAKGKDINEVVEFTELSHSEVLKIKDEMN